MTVNPEPLTFHEGEEDKAVHEETIRVLDQDFPIPDDAYRVRIQVGDMPLSTVGWIGSPDYLPHLLRNIAEQHEITMKEWDDATPSARG